MLSSGFFGSSDESIKSEIQRRGLSNSEAIRFLGELFNYGGRIGHYQYQRLVKLYK